MREKIFKLRSNDGSRKSMSCETHKALQVWRISQSGVQVNVSHRHSLTCAISQLSLIHI